MSTHEAARLGALHRYRILDTEPEEAFDDLTMLASQICATPVALISLIDSRRQWFKSRIGTTVQETARDIAFCARAIEQPDLFVVTDALRDERFRENPMVVGEPNVRFYAGAPLITAEGHALGTICVLDYVARTLTETQRAALEALRRQAMAQLELRRNLDELAVALAERDTAEAEQTALVADLRASLDRVNRLSGLMPFCSTCEMNMVIPADPSAIHRVSEGVEQLLVAKHWPAEERQKVELALQEALANAIRHGCKGDAGQRVQCVISFDAAGEIVIVVRDPGPGFDPAQVPNPLAGDNIFRSSGRGVFLINQLMDEVAFRDGGREILMRKGIARASRTLH